MSYCVYMHITPNGKRYIGITSLCVDRRWENGSGYRSQVFYRAIKKYGWDNIKHIVLFENLTKDEAEKKETELIKKYNSNNPKFGYNRNEGGQLGCKHTEETKKKMSISQKKRFEREEERERLSSYAIGRTPWNKGKKMDEYYRRKLSEAKKGKIGSRLGTTQSDETRKKLSEIQKGKILKESTKNKIHEANAYIVLKYDMNDNLIGRYTGTREAGKSIGKENANSTISKCCRGEQKTAYGYIWKYEKLSKE